MKLKNREVHPASEVVDVPAPAAVRLHMEGMVANLVLDRPARGNSIDLEMARSLLGAAERCAAEPGVRCVTLTGAGRIFCAGGNLAAFAAADHLPDYLEELIDTLNRAVLALAGMGKPLVVLVNGPAAGAGLSLALAADIVLAADSAHFTAAYTAVGLTPDGGLTWWLPRVIGLRKAQEMILTNRRVRADEAVAIGIVTRAVEQDALADEGRKVAEELARSATIALGASRDLLAGAFNSSLRDQLGAELSAIVAASDRCESREGIAAFLERRAPNFAGC